MNDDIVFQPGNNDGGAGNGPNENPVVKVPDEDAPETSPGVYDFSPDLNISEVKDDTAKSAVPVNPFKPISVTPSPRKFVTANPPSKPAPTPIPTPPPVKPVSVPVPTPAPILTPAPLPPQNVPQNNLQAGQLDESPLKKSLEAGNEMHPWPFASDKVKSELKPPQQPEPGPTVNLINKNVPAQSPRPVPTPGAVASVGFVNANASKPSSAPIPANLPVESPTAPAPGTMKSWTPMSLHKPPTPIFTPQPSPKPSLASLSEKPELAKAGDTTFLKNLRTYESDIADALSHRGKAPTSVASVAIAESKRKGEGETIKNLPPMSAVSASREKSVDEEPSHAGSKLIIILVSIILIGAGAITGYFLYSKSPLATVTTPVAPKGPTMLPSLVPSDSQAVIMTDSLNQAGLFARIKTELAKPQTKGTIKEIILIETKDAMSYRVSATEMVDLLKLDMPDIIKRTLKPQWMLGAYSDVDAGVTPFVVVTTNLFQNAFAGMLTWEGTMGESLKTILNPSIAPSTPGPKGHFRDEILKNKDIRVFVGEDGQTILEYSFLDNEMLVVTTNDAAMNAVINRLESKAFVR